MYNVGLYTHDFLLALWNTIETVPCKPHLSADKINNMKIVPVVYFQLHFSIPLDENVESSLQSFRRP